MNPEAATFLGRVFILAAFVWCIYAIGKTARDIREDGRKSRGPRNRW